MRFEFEWQEAPGVRDRVLAATWARFGLWVSRQCLTEAIDLRSASHRTGVYGSIYPLAAWFVENWWQLLHEPPPRTPVPGGRAAPATMRRWVQRHNLLAARDGGALPDLSFIRDGADILIRWEPDPVSTLPARVRFVGQGTLQVAAGEVERSLADFVEAVLLRLEERLPGNEEVVRLRVSWDAIRNSDAKEETLCKSLAMMGVDPYDPDEATDALVETVERGIRILPRDLRSDLFEGSEPHFLKANLDWIERERCALRSAIDPVNVPAVEIEWAGSAHEVGYLAARRVRSELLATADDQPLLDLPSLFIHRLGWTERCSKAGSSGASLDGMVGLDEDESRPLLVTARSRSARAERFRLARAAFFPVTGSLGTGARLITDSGTVQQRASRAFAAELLAPASALARRIAGRLNDDELDEMADEYQVSPLVIRHQIENHGLG